MILAFPMSDWVCQFSECFNKAWFTDFVNKILLYIFILRCTVVETPGRGVLEDFSNSFSWGGGGWYLVRDVKKSTRVPEVSVLLIEKFPFSIISFSFEKDFIKPYKLCLLNRRSLSVLHLSPSF